VVRREPVRAYAYDEIAERELVETDDGLGVGAAITGHRESAPDISSPLA
jgi:hypothetical protein